MLYVHISFQLSKSHPQYFFHNKTHVGNQVNCEASPKRTKIFKNLIGLIISALP